MNDSPISAAIERKIAAIVEGRSEDFDLVIVTDFGHGLVTPSMIAMLERSARFLAVNAQSNSANMGFNLITRYSRADYICIDVPEARLAASDRFSDVATLTGDVLPRAHRLPAFRRHSRSQRLRGLRTRTRTGPCPGFYQDRRRYRRGRGRFLRRQRADGGGRRVDGSGGGSSATRPVRSRSVSSDIAVPSNGCRS